MRHIRTTTTVEVPGRLPGQPAYGAGAWRTAERPPASDKETHLDVEHNKTVVRRLLDAVVGGGDMELVGELCSPDVVNHAAAPGRQHGIENLRAVLEFSRTAQPDQSWVEQHVVGDGDLVVVYGRRRGTWQASSFRGLETPADVPVSVELAHMFRLENGQIVEHWAVRDDLGMMQQLGVL